MNRWSSPGRLRGAVVLLRTQPNARIHFSATVGAIVAGLLCGISRGEWIAIGLAVAMVWCAEALNTAIELLGDEISLEHRERIGRAKDVAAFAVLCAAATALVVAGFVFLPRVANLG
ncbi:diacylglycerol kinase [Opitutales bacterium ASA1]|uniref:diacylglycerol kinase family protein n=1 Tax=Congregicoccus parvus TaxID=3081749 RepID=UPI002B2C97E4|nr:diacylglycerol kinase [Opitutales bacterium ASA1]